MGGQKPEKQSAFAQRRLTKMVGREQLYSLFVHCSDVCCPPILVGFLPTLVVSNRSMRPTLYAGSKKFGGQRLMGGRKPEKQSAFARRRLTRMMGSKQLHFIFVRHNDVHRSSIIVGLLPTTVSGRIRCSTFYDELLKNGETDTTGRQKTRKAIGSCSTMASKDDW